MNRIRGKRPEDRFSRLRAANRPSNYILPFTTIQRGDKVRIWCRVSSDTQDANGNNRDQERELRAAIEAVGGVVTGVETYVGVAGSADESLYRASNRAAREGTVLLTEMTSRFARHPKYHSKKRYQLVAGKCELENLRWVCGDVPLVTLHDPDMTSREEKIAQTKRGQRQKNKPGGRPIKPSPGYKKRQREKLLPEVKRLFGKGMSIREVARTLRTSERNVRRWLRRF